MKENELRLCTVKGATGYFHVWEQYSEPIAASAYINGHPAGLRSRVYGIVEFPNGCRRIDPEAIKFCDEKNNLLRAFYDPN